jgi:hypothetical protein
MGYIYQIKNNKSEKCYIGQTTTLPESRWKKHISSLTHKGGCPALKDAIAKYGIEKSRRISMEIYNRIGLCISYRTHVLFFKSNMI